MATRLRAHSTVDDAGMLMNAIHARTATIGVVGMGYVGLPLAIAAGLAGFPVIGYDDDNERVGELAAGRSYVTDVSDDQVATLQARFTSSPRALKDADIFIVAVPTPLTDGMPDLQMVEDAVRRIAYILKPGMLVILESTTYPGTTEEIVSPILELSGLKAGVDFFLGYSPERIDPGSGRSLADTPKIVSGMGEDAGDLVEAFYAQFVKEVVRVPLPRDAEMAKLIENTFRHVNIALVNELAMLAPHLGVDIWSALEAAATKPFGYMAFWPGPGVGGHCIAIDPSYLSWRVSQQLGFGMGFVEHAKEVNQRMPTYVASRIGDALNIESKPLNGSRILAIGVTYKPGVNDVRESPAVAVLDHLTRAGAVCSYHDPYIESVALADRDLHSVELNDETLTEQDCVVILTPHPDIDLARVVRTSRLVFDARGATRDIHATNIVRL